MINTEALNIINDYITKKIPRVFKEKSDTFPYPFIDPGSIYDGNLWDWDSFWTVYSLFGYIKHVCIDDDLKNKFIEHAKGGVLNFLHFQMDDGYIPMMVGGLAGEGLSSYLLEKHKEGLVLNMHKPFLCQQIALINENIKTYDWISDHIQPLLKYFKCYDRYYFNETCGLYVWADDVMIGFDNDPATFGRPRFSTANVYLNAFMVSEFDAMIKILNHFKQKEHCKLFTNKKQALIAAIQAECWDARDQFFYSADIDIKTRSYDWFHKGLGVFWKSLPIKVRTWTGFIPLYANIATKEQAEVIVKKHITDPHTFASDFGIRSLSKDEKMYNLEATNNPSNWLGPIWLVVNYVVFKGLLNYGYVDEAVTLCNQTLTLLSKDIKKSGDMHEYYNPETGEPIMSPGFLNWNVLVNNMADELNRSALL